MINFWGLVLALAAIWCVHSKIRLVAGHKRELRTVDAAERILRWFMVVSVVWVIVCLLRESLLAIEFVSAFTVSPPDQNNQ